MEQKVIINISDLRTIANAIRERTDTTDTMKFYEFARKILGIAADGTLYLLEDDDGNQMYATLVGDEPVDITATENDIRIGKTAVSSEGLIVGKNTITYRTYEGSELVLPNKEFRLSSLTDYNQYNYTKLQCIITRYASNVNDRMAAEKIVLNDSVFNVGSSVKISTITKNQENKMINFNITNDTNYIYIIYFFTYCEEVV